MANGKGWEEAGKKKTGGVKKVAKMGDVGRDWAVSVCSGRHGRWGTTRGQNGGSGRVTEATGCRSGRERVLW